MKAIVLLVASACLINGLAASSVDFPLENEIPEIDESEKSFEIDDHLNVLTPDKLSPGSLIVPFPTDDPNEVTFTTTSRPRPTWRPTTITTTRRPTTTTKRPRPTWRPTWRPTTTTKRPRPTWRPTWRPTTSRPTTPRPSALRNPQIYKNAVRSLGPFAGRLVNVVLNRQGAQKTVQENEIVYNLNSILNRTLLNNEEETEN